MIVGDVLAGRVEQGIVRSGEGTFYLPAHAVSSPCTWKFVTMRSVNVLSYKLVEAPGARERYTSAGRNAVIYDMAEIRL